MSNSGGSSRVSIPNSVRKTIQDIKEITGNHSEEDIYAMLKDCSMDPNETTQRLLHLDTFHEVKRKRDKRKENVKSRSAEESRGKPGYQGRGIRGARGASYSQYSSNDAGGRRNAAIRKENGVDESREKSFRQSPAPVAKRTDAIQPLHVEKSSFITTNGPVKVPNGTLSGGLGAQSSGVGDTHLLKESSDASSDTSSRTIPKVNTEHAPPIPNDKGMGTTESMGNSHLNQHEPQNADGLDISSSMIKEEAIGQKVSDPKILGECSVAERICTPECNPVVKSSASRGTGQIGGVEEAASKLEKLKFPDGKHVIIPDHIQVPDAIKNVLSFGSLGASFGVRENNLNSESKENSKPVPDLVQEETALEPPSCDQDLVTIAPEGKIMDHLQSPSVPEKMSPSDPKVSSVATDPKNDKLEEEILPAVGPPFPVVQTTPSYSFGFMPPMLVNPLVHPEAFESQAPVSDSLNGSSPPISTSASTPPPTQPNVGQNSVAMSPLQIALFRQPFPPNYIPYSHYYSPIYVPPNMHQYFGHTAFPPTLPAGNVYLTPPAAAGGMKISPGPYKLGANTGNQVHTGLPSSYGAYTPSQVAVGPNGAVTSGNPTSTEDLVPSALKENNVYPLQQSEGPAVWFGRDTGSFPLNSFINIPPQQHPQGISPQSGPGGAFAVYHALQPMASPGPGPGLTLLQQLSQPMAGPTESSVGPPSNAYQQQQPQRLQQQQQMNWNM